MGIRRWCAYIYGVAVRPRAAADPMLPVPVILQARRAQPAGRHSRYEAAVASALASIGPEQGTLVFAVASAAELDRPSGNVRL